MEYGATIGESGRPDDGLCRAKGPQIKAITATAMRFHYIPCALLIALLIPKEFYFKLESSLLSPYRILLVIMCPLVLIKFARNANLGFSFVDCFVIAFSFWGALSHLVNSGFAGGAVSAGLFFIETGVPYLIARCYICNHDTFTRLMRLYVATVIVLFFVAAIESIFGQYFVHFVSAAITGQAFSLDMETRAGGLGRAMGPFDHPILYGAYCASALGIIWFNYRGFRKFLYATICIGAVIWSMSSGPLLGVAFQLIFIAYERMTRSFPRRVTFVLVSSVLAICVLQAASGRSIIEVAMDRLTLDPHTAWFRLATWQYATATIANHPLFGIAFQSTLYDSTLPEWMQLEMNTSFSSSVDSFILANTLFYGLPEGAFLFFSAASAIYRAASRKRNDLKRHVHAATMGWTCSLLSLCFISITVQYWGPMLVFFFFFLGSGVWLGKKSQQPTRVRDEVSCKPDTHWRRNVSPGAIIVGADASLSLSPVRTRL